MDLATKNFTNKIKTLDSNLLEAKYGLHTSQKQKNLTGKCQCLAVFHHLNNRSKTSLLNRKYSVNFV